MKKYIIISWLSISVFAALVFFLSRNGHEASLGEQGSDQSWVQGKPRVLEDDVEVFQQAFWARPNADDEIAHAIRLSWIEGGDVSGWRWFIQLKPSEQTIQRLINNNSFRLSRYTELPLPDQSPPWFQPNTTSACYSSESQDMNLYWDSSNRQLFGWGGGAGFQAAVRR